MSDMRVRQIALVAKELEPVLAQLDAVFGLKVGFRDPGVAYYGLINAVMPAGGHLLSGSRQAASFSTVSIELSTPAQSPGWKWVKM